MLLIILTFKVCNACFHELKPIEINASSILAIALSTITV